jgi:hypothetical protein
MPALVGYEGVRDFIACVAYGMLVDAISADRSGQLLYAAQIALNTLPRAPQPANLACAPHTPLKNRIPPAQI